MDSKIWYIPAKNDRLEKNVGIYCRVSTSERDQLNSLSAQISALTRAISHVSQWKFSDTFIDIASTKGDSPRREFERMIQEYEYQIKDNHLPIITENEYRSVQEEKM